MIDEKLREQLENRLYEKMSAENEAYLADMKTKPVDEIIQNAYQIAWRENMLYLFEDETPLTVRQLEVLLELEQPLTELYDRWLKQDTNEIEGLRDYMKSSAKDVLQQRADAKYSNAETPLYPKTFEDARLGDELYEWRADHLRNCACNQMFSKQAGTAHAEQKLQPFLQQWTQQYGVERCMFVLACTMEQRRGDGRFYPLARQAAARFFKLIENRSDQTYRYANNVHSGIVNLAMEELVKMERQHTPEKQHNKKKQDRER